MNKVKEILNKIKKYFISIFNSRSIKLIDEYSSPQNEEFTEFNDFELNDLEFDDVNYYDDYDYADTSIEKKEFFIIYENLKNGIISPSDLMIGDLIKVQLMMENEIKIMDEKVEAEEKEIKQMESEIITLKKQLT